MGFRDERFARDYERRMSREGYPGNLLDAVFAEMEGVRTVIDVGAGTGFFAIPLARRGLFVEAVEPSAPMRAIFAAKMDDVCARRITLTDATWRDWKGRRAGAVLCVHSIYPLPDTGAALEKMHAYGRKVVIIMRADAGSVVLSDIIRRELGLYRPAGALYRRVLRHLRDMGIAYHTRPLVQERVSRFGDITAEARYYCRHLGLGADMVPDVQRIMRRNACREGGGYAFHAAFHDRLVVING